MQTLLIMLTVFAVLTVGAYMRARKFHREMERFCPDFEETIRRYKE